MKLNFRKVIFFITLFLVIFAVSVGFYLTGGPKHQRKIRYDSKRAQIITELSRKVGYYYRDNKKLPKKLENLKDVQNNRFRYIDPQTEVLPEYKKISNEKFELCMTFSTSNLSDIDNKNYGNYHYKYKHIKHKAGYHCAVYNKIGDTKVFELEE